MKENFSLKFKKMDILTLIICGAFIVCLFIFTLLIFPNLNKDKRVEVYYKGQLISNEVYYESKWDQYEKNADGYIEIILTKDKYNTLQGDMIIEYSLENGIRVKEVTCPNHLCEKMGWVNIIGYPVTCVPNEVYVIITSNDNDTDIVLG